MYDYVTPQKLLDALSFLKANNPLYANIDVNQEWLEAAVANDADLFECLVNSKIMLMSSQTLIILLSLLLTPPLILLWMLNCPLIVMMFSPLLIVLLMLHPPLILL